MLILTRRIGQSLIIGDGESEMIVTLIKTGIDYVKFHISGNVDNPGGSFVTISGVPNKDLYIGVGDADLTVTRVERNQVRFGIDAPYDVEIDRAEIRERKEAERNG